MASAVKRKLSGSTDGRAIALDQTSSPGTTIHTSVAGTTAGTFDEVWLWAFNSDSTDRSLTLEYGGTTAPDDNIVLTVPYQSGLVPVVPGLILQNSSVVRAFSDTTGVITLSGYVNSITD